MDVEALAVADFNGDGRADVAFAANFDESSVAVWFGGVNSSLDITASPDPAIYLKPVTVAARVTPTTATGHVIFYDGVNLLGSAQLHSGTAQLSIPGLQSGSHALKARYSGDLVDAPSSGAATLAVTTNTSSASVTFEPWSGGGTFPTGNGPFSVAAADFNRDGKPDIAVANLYDNTVTVLLQSGGTFVPAPGSPYTVGANPTSVVIADFNSDGIPDLLVANDSGSTVTVLLGQGGGSFIEDSTQVKVNNNPFQIAVADYNSDGNPDIAVSNYNGGGLGPTVVFGDGAGGLLPGVGNFQYAFNETGIAAADFDGDGNADIVVTDPQNGSIGVGLGKGDGSFIDAPASHLNPIVGAFSVAVGDFNGDGHPDLAVANFTYETLSIYLGDGTGAFTEALGSPYQTGAISAYVTTLDFNGDGKLDLAVANTNTNSVLLLLGDGAGRFGIWGSRVPSKSGCSQPRLQ